MRRVRLLVVLALATVIVVGGGAYAVVRHEHVLPTVTCRDLLDSAETHQLPASVVRDLDDPAFGVDVDALALPTAARVDDIRHALQRHDLTPGPKDALACGTGTAGILLLVRQADIPLEHCYGPAGACGGIATERRTCAALYAATAAAVVRDYGCPALG